MEKNNFDSETGIVLIGACKFESKYFKLLTDELQRIGIEKEIVCRFWYDEENTSDSARYKQFFSHHSIYL